MCKAAATCVPFLLLTADFLASESGSPGAVLYGWTAGALALLHCGGRASGVQICHRRGSLFMRAYLYGRGLPDRRGIDEQRRNGAGTGCPCGGDAWP